MKFSHVLMMASALAFFACGDDSSSTAASSTPASSTSAKSSDDSKKSSDDKAKEETKFDCTVTDGVKVVSPKAGDSFKMGDKITVVYGSDVKGSGYRFLFKASESDPGTDLLEESAGPESPDGKTCYEQEVVLTEDVAEATETAIIRVVPYEKTAKAGNSGTFKVSE